MSALAEKIKSLAESNDFDTLVEILLELEARQPNYTIQVFPNPGPIPAAGPVYPFISPTPYPYPSTFPRIGEPTWPNTTICHNSNSNGPVPQSDATGYVDPSPSNPTGYGTLKLVGDGTPKNPSLVVYDRDVVKSLERKIEEDGDNRFSRKPVGYGG